MGTKWERFFDHMNSKELKRKESKGRSVEMVDDWTGG